MNTGKYNAKHSVALLLSAALSIFCSMAQAEHGGRDQTERDDHQSESRSGSDRDHSRDSDHGSSHADESHDNSNDGDKNSGKEGKDKDSKKEPGDHKNDNGSGRQIDTSLANSKEKRFVTELDFEGHERRTGEVIMIGRDSHVEAVRGAGYKIISTQTLGSLDESITRIRVSAGESVEQAMQRLHTIDPDAEIASNHLFHPSQQATSNRNEAAIPAARNTNSIVSSHFVIGVIDTGADQTRELLKLAIVDTQGLTENGYVPRTHGTIVSQIACTEGARLAVADVFGVDSENRLVAPAEAIARGIDWLLSKHVMLINVSIEGPDNMVLSHVIHRAIEKGAVIVAAAGNSGPAAPPSYPAAYPGVIAVTAVDENNVVYPRANRGEYITFAARGVRIPFNDGSTQGTVSGTSFAAPVIAAEIVRRMAESSGDASAAIENMKRDAVDLGQPGRDNVFGWGMITLRPSAPR